MSDLADRLADRCLELCSIPSVTGEEARICDHVEGWARGFVSSDDVRRIGNSIVLGRPRSTGRPSIALVGHLDTVPPHRGDPPPGREGDELVGLGSSDMKGGVAVAMALFEDLWSDGLPYELTLVLYDREEGPHLESGLRTLLEEIPWLSRTDLAVVMEPTDGVVQVGCVGTLHATLTFEGRSAHSARPWQGRNAIHAAGSLLAELDERSPLEVEQGGEIFKEVFTVTLAEGGRYRNVVPDTFTLNLNHRFAPTRTLDQAKQSVRDLVAGRADVEFVDLCPSCPVPADNPHLASFLEITGRPVRPKQAWTDVARLAEVGVDAVNFGPGLVAQAHQAGEHCTVSGLVAAYRDVRSFLEAERAVE